MEIKFEVDVDENEYEFVGYRVPRVGELYLDGNIYEVGAASTTQGPRLVFRDREPFMLPIRPGWIAMDEDGEWNWYKSRPEMYEDCWSGCGSSYVEIPPFFQMPPCDDWRKSLRKV